jgi:hypothetical protein
MTPGRLPSLLLLAFLLAGGAWAQRVSPFQNHYRVYAILDKDPHAKCNKDDPCRPRFIPNPKKKDASDLKILAWTAILSPDKKRYFVEIVAANKADLAPLLNDPSVTWWDKAVTPPDKAQKELAKFNAGAQIERLKVRAR